MEHKEMIALLKSQMHMTYAERNEIAVHMNALSERLHQQEAEIEKLVQERGTMKASSPTMEWISVEDGKEMPDAFSYTGIRHDQFPRLVIVTDENRKVTHWMMLDAPKPKEQTFKDVFLKAFPKARLYGDGFPISCRAVIFGGKCLMDRPKCSECWNQPYFEPKEEGEADA